MSNATPLAELITAIRATADSLHAVVSAVEDPRGLPLMYRDSDTPPMDSPEVLKCWHDYLKASDKSRQLMAIVPEGSLFALYKERFDKHRAVRLDARDPSRQFAEHGENEDAIADVNHDRGEDTQRSGWAKKSAARLHEQRPHFRLAR